MPNNFLNDNKILGRSILVLKVEKYNYAKSVRAINKYLIQL
jgi:hypothetical protein